MSAPRRLLLAGVGALLACAMLMPTRANGSPKPLDAETVRTKIVKRGVRNWACVEEKNGLALCGRIAAIGDASFGLQLHNYPEVTEVLYGEVLALHFGLSRKAVFALLGGNAAAAAITVVVMQHEFDANKPKLPPTPLARK